MGESTAELVMEMWITFQCGTMAGARDAVAARPGRGN